MSPRIEYPTSLGSRKAVSPLSTNAILCRLLMRPSGECSGAGIMYHSLIARRNEFGVAKSLFGQCYPKA